MCSNAMPTDTLPRATNFTVIHYHKLCSEAECSHQAQQGPALSTGLHAVFRFPSAIDAVHYRDGDGATLDCTLIPGLKDYIEKMQLGDLLQLVGQDSLWSSGNLTMML